MTLYLKEYQNTYTYCLISKVDQFCATVVHKILFYIGVVLSRDFHELKLYKPMPKPVFLLLVSEILKNQRSYDLKVHSVKSVAG